MQGKIYTSDATDATNTDTVFNVCAIWLVVSHSSTVLDLSDLVTQKLSDACLGIINFVNLSSSVTVYETGPILTSTLPPPITFPEVRA